MRQVVLEWHRAVRLAQTCHLRSAAETNKGRKRIGILVTIISAVVGTSIFASLQAPDLPQSIKIVVGLLSMLAATLSAIQGFMKGSDKLEEHRISASVYSSLRLELESFWPKSVTDADWTTFETSFRKRFIEANEKAPTFSQEIHDAAEKHMAKRVTLKEL